ncbi:ABC-type Fe3+ transport system, periplasmic component [Corynebacterium camporealensis]|uniref:ABC-type Fe3+ transport system, periplasmic component n=1 Tax=Corynebacterium camporealensis TaxID=161896 RepID=A0A0F6QVS8_9CORY|nr:ABC transporter substrate-binding protein [Corynebacterium camporealensis]AKE39002.1 ABC-type Fe3+ transport system, periplasmic component [Corynebacterium camporealensis]AVH88239.1 ABC-type Fe3+ transport system, periplasmic component [Corynebacterium camporealensis]
MRRLTLTAVMSLTAAGLVACSEPTTGSDNAADNGSGETQTITVYTSEPEEKVDEINAAFNEQHPDIEVEVYRAGTGDLNARIESEKSTGEVEADILWAADAATFEGYSDDLIELDLDTDALIDEVKDEENKYIGTRIIPTVIAYNTNEIDEAPESWAELTDEKYADQLIMPDPAVSGAAAFNAAVWDEELDDDWMEKLGENQPMIAQSNGPTSQEIASGARPVGVVVDYLIRDLEADGSPVALSYPTEGVPYVSEPAGIFESSDAQDAALKYIEFLISEEGQKLAVEQAYLPVREDVDTPEDTPALSEIELMDPDLDTITENMDAAVAKFQDAVK